MCLIGVFAEIEFLIGRKLFQIGKAHIDAVFQTVEGYIVYKVRVLIVSIGNILFAYNRTPNKYNKNNS